jgi:hypothetical protein
VKKKKKKKKSGWTGKIRLKVVKGGGLAYLGKD